MGGGEGGPSNLNLKRQKEQEQKVKIGIKGQDGSEMYYSIRREKKMQRLFMQYCKDKNMEYGTVTFLYDGVKIYFNKSAAKIGLEDGDMIEAMMNANGGGFRSF